MPDLKIHIRNPSATSYYNKPLCAPKNQKRFFIVRKEGDPLTENLTINCLSCLKKAIAP